MLERFERTPSTVKQLLGRALECLLREKTVSDQILDREQTIKVRARAIWERAGRTEGKDIEHWRQAEQELAIDAKEVLQGDQENLHQAIETTYRQLSAEEQRQLHGELERLREKEATPEALAEFADEDKGDDVNESREVKELRRLFVSLDGPQRLLEQSPGYNRPPFEGLEAKWSVPKYIPEPQDFPPERILQPKDF
jgi:hypothetical protein